MSAKSWTSPSHHNIKSPDFGTLCRGKPLTDRRILHYTALGHYGITAQQKLLAKREAAASKKRKPISHPPVTLDSLEDLLS